MSRINNLLFRCLGSDDAGGFQPIGFEARLKSIISESSQDESTFMLMLLNIDWGPDKWTQASLADEAQEFKQLLKEGYPDLEPVIVCALANRWSYGWR